jgi:UDP-2-acetamido-2,6-beta-L-arabino-hexul-4-ose reductase
MINIGITGFGGFVGSHLCFHLRRHKNDYSPVLIGKEDYVTADKLAEKIMSCHVIIHLAGLNRGEDEVIYQTNVSLTQRLLSALSEVDRRPTIIFLSSTHNARDTAYGKSKRDSQKLIANWGRANNAKTISIVAPNIFGEFGKPYYNSAVATFCYELAEKKESAVNEAGKVELIYVGEICSLILDLLLKKDSEDTHVVSGKVLKISEVYELLKHLMNDYHSGIIPLCSDPFEMRMFNTLRSYLYPKYFPVPLELKADNRGMFVELSKARIGGQSSFSTTRPGIVRGNHYHTRKIERFCVIKGEAIIRLRRLLSNEVIEYKVSGAKPAYVDMPTYYTHSIENIGKDELLTMFWINEMFNPDDPDTFSEPVIDQSCRES